MFTRQDCSLFTRYLLGWLRFYHRIQRGETLPPLKVRTMLVCETPLLQTRQKRKKIFFVERASSFHSLHFRRSNNSTSTDSLVLPVWTSCLDGMTCRIHGHFSYHQFDRYRWFELLYATISTPTLTISAGFASGARHERMNTRAYVCPHLWSHHSKCVLARRESVSIDWVSQGRSSVTTLEHDVR